VTAATRRIYVSCFASVLRDTDTRRKPSVVQVPDLLLAFSESEMGKT